MERYLWIERFRQGYILKADYDNVPWRARFGISYIGYSKKAAVKAFRAEIHMTGKHFIVIDETI